MKNWISRAMRKSKDQKGMTLVELLAVIVIMGIVAAIATMSIGGIIGNSKGKADDRTEEIIQSAAEIWAADNPADATNGDKDIQTTLVSKGYLKSVPVSQEDSSKSYKTFKVAVASGVVTITVNPPVAS